MCILHILKIESLLQKVYVDSMIGTCQTWSWVSKSLLFEDKKNTGFGIRRQRFRYWPFVLLALWWY